MGKRITAAERKSLPKSEFALPGKPTKGKPGKGGYPDDTPGRARAALSRAKQFATPAEQATIRRRVKARYPSMVIQGGKKKGGK